MGKRVTIRERMRECIEDGDRKSFLSKDLNYAKDAQETYKYIYPLRDKLYVDPDMYSPLLYKAWGELLLKKNIISSYKIVEKNYRYVIQAEYSFNEQSNPIILGSDGVISVRKCGENNIEQHKFIGGFVLWPSHKGGINFRKNRYKDDLFKTLKDVERFYEDSRNYKGVIPEADYGWFEYLNTKGGYIDIFFLSDYERYRENIVDFEKKRTQEILSFMGDVK